ncbi:MAG: phosphoribosylanthranilate isomerase [Ignavibacteria bacterium]|nr:phosphoribosylanthranilate isomerase [Ignavibacteria bacterium]
MKYLPRVKICCIKNIEEAKNAIAYGASAIGLVGRMPSGPGPITDEEIKIIAENTPPPIATFLLTCETSVDKIAEHHRRVNTNTIQIVDALNGEIYKELKEKLPSVKIVQVIHVIDESSVDEAVRISEQVDGLLLDSGNPNKLVKELGGTGRKHDWKLSRKIVEQSKVPLFLAGGLNPSNVRQAIEEVQPFGVDLCSGLRPNGDLDLKLMEEFFAEVNKV